MKLVNVEDLKVLVAVESKGEIRYGKLVTDLFDDITTVEAIPVEWIEKKLNCCDNINAEIFVKALIREWEKENEGK